jgi:hypothetical protein
VSARKPAGIPCAGTKVGGRVRACHEATDGMRAELSMYAVKVARVCPFRGVWLEGCCFWYRSWVRVQGGGK